MIKFSPAIKLIKNSKKILLHLHPSPDFDSVGSALALAAAVKQLHLSSTVISGDSRLPENFCQIPGIKCISTKNYFEINPEDYDLFVILDSSSPDQISKIKPIVFPPQLQTLVIDHHDSNTHFAQVNIVDTKSPATCQIVFQLITKMGLQITQDIAACLFLGLYGDTGGFKYERTTSLTFEIASVLAKINTKLPSLIFKLENNDTADRLRLIGLMLNHIDTFYHNQVAIAALPASIIREHKINLEVANNIEVANMLKSVVGWDIGISMIETDDHRIKISFRTRNPDLYDLGMIAQATGFGGGHKAAAGASIPLPLSEAKSLVLETIKKLYPQI